MSGWLIWTVFAVSVALLLIAASTEEDKLMRVSFAFAAGGFLWSIGAFIAIAIQLYT